MLLFQTGNFAIQPGIVKHRQNFLEAGGRAQVEFFDQIVPIDDRLDIAAIVAELVEAVSQEGLFIGQPTDQDGLFHIWAEEGVDLAGSLSMAQLRCCLFDGLDMV